MLFINFNIFFFFSLQGKIDECTNKEEEKERESSKRITQSMTKNLCSHRNVFIHGFQRLRTCCFTSIVIV